MKPRWSTRSLNDLARLYDHLDQYDAGAATRAIRLIQTKTDLLDAFPELGPLDPQRQKMRCLYVAFGKSSYVVRYRILSSGQPFITRVFHSRESR